MSRKINSEENQMIETNATVENNRETAEKSGRKIKKIQRLREHLHGKNEIDRVLDSIEQKNTGEVNGIIARALQWVFVLIWLLLFANSGLKLFDFTLEVKLIIAIFGTVVTVTPAIMYYFKVPDNFLKYYMLIMIEILVALLGMQNSIGIYMTFLLAPVASCLYFDKQLTKNITIFSYVSMAVAVYFNAFGRFETVYFGWPQFTVFIMYLAGFTFEYIIVFLFLKLIVKRVTQFVTEQQNMVIQLRSERERYRLIMESTQDIMFDYDPEWDVFRSTNSVYKDGKEPKEEVYMRNFLKYVNQLPLQDPDFKKVIEEAFQGKEFHNVEVNLSKIQDGKVFPKWYLVEGSFIKNEDNKPIRLVGKLHDITPEKQYDMEKKAAADKDQVTGLYLYHYFEQCLKNLSESDQKGVAISILIENFRQLEDAYGYVYCDSILQNIAEVIKKIFGQNGYFCRLHGAHFVVFVSRANFKDGFLYKQELQKALDRLYVGEKEVSTLAANIYFKNIRVEELDDMLSEVDGLGTMENPNTSVDNRRPMYEVLKMDKMQLTDEDYAQIADGQKFMLTLMDLLKYSKDIRSSMHVVLAKAGNYFKLDRIVIVESDMAECSNRFTYQWNRYPEDEIQETYYTMTQEEKKQLMEDYDKQCYLEFNSPDMINEFGQYLGKQAVADMIRNSFMAVQLWLPTLSDGEYNGAFFFDRKENNPFTTIEKYLLSELVNTLTVYVTKLNADLANKAKSTFLSNMSHEIRTPMNAIIGMAEVALREDISDSQRQYLETIRSAGNGLLTIINDILDFSKIESGKIEIVDDNYEILSLLNDVNVIAQERNKEKKLDLKLEMPNDLPKTLYGDMVRIKQVIVNLANNAIKYTDQGSVRIKVDCDKPVDDMVTLRVAVKDTGMGIKQEDIDKLFQSFSQVDTTRNHHKEGTGLGLAISKQLIELMGGSIRVESVYGKGSTFSFELPQKLVDATPAGQLKDYKIVSDNGAEMQFIAPEAHILLVDDNRMNLRVAMKLLEPLQMQMEMAESGMEAIDKAEKMDFDLIFMDHMMPVMDGIEATRRIRQLGEKYENLPIIAFTANAMSGVEEMFLEAGLNDFLSKPIDGKTICAKVRQWISPDKIQEISTEEANKVQAAKSAEGLGENASLSDERTDAMTEPEETQIDDLNIEEGIKNSGSKKLFYSLLGDFYKLIDIKTNKMEKCLEDGLIRDFTIEVHALKNTARMIGAMDLSKMAADLEKAGNDGNHDFLKTHAKEALEKYKSYKQSLKKYGRRDDAGKPMIEGDELAQKMNLVKDAMNEFDIDAVDHIMKELEQYRIPEQATDLFEELEAAVADVDMENVIRIAEQINRMGKE